MKLRIKGNSIRFRLTQPEVAQLARSGRVEESLNFPGGGRLDYAVEASERADALQTQFSGELMTIFVPRVWVASWEDSDQVGFDESVELDGGARLELTVEKDFECLHKRPDDRHAYPHPLAEQEGSALSGRPRVSG